MAYLCDVNNGEQEHAELWAPTMSLSSNKGL